MSNTFASKRADLVAALKNLPPFMRRRLLELKAEAKELRKRPDLLWYLLLQSAATWGKSAGWDGLCADPATLASVAYSKLADLDQEDCQAELLAALRKAKVRWATRKARLLAANVSRIQEKGGNKQATKEMLGLSGFKAKFNFIRSFAGIGVKYGRNVWMDIYDADFRDSIAVDQRLDKLRVALGLADRGYKAAENFFGLIAREAGLEPWELDRLLYNFTDHFLRVVGYEPPKRRTRSIREPRGCLTRRDRTQYGSRSGTGAASLDTVILDFPLGREFTAAEAAAQVQRRRLPERGAIREHLRALRERGFLRRTGNGWVRLS
jgi:hypothetical protein